ncbi:alkylmercury lyase family protein [Kaarinaea lacus]
MDIKQALARLNSQLPLKARQDQLGRNLKLAHQNILRSLVNRGRPLTETELIPLLGKDGVDSSIQQLAQIDLVVLDKEGVNIVGAYPVTIETTPHRITVNRHTLFAMCALDAVSVAPMFNTEVQIKSRCHVTHDAITITMRNDNLLTVLPSQDITVGVRWQMPTGAAAHSMCLEMVFLLNEQVALEWQKHNTENYSLFALPEAVEFGKRFFRPLLD